MSRYNIIIFSTSSDKVYQGLRNKIKLNKICLKVLKRYRNRMQLSRALDSSYNEFISNTGVTLTITTNHALPLIGHHNKNRYSMRIKSWAGLNGK